MIKSCIAFLLIFSMLVAHSTRYLIYAGFKLNQGYIAAVFCENKEKPVLKCEGKCYLTKKLKQAEESSESKDTNSQKSHFFESFIQGKLTINFDLQLIGIFKSNVLQSELPRHTSTLFHPPNGIQHSC